MTNRLERLPIALNRRDRTARWMCGPLMALVVLVPTVWADGGIAGSGGLGQVAREIGESSETKDSADANPPARQTPELTPAQRGTIERYVEQLDDDQLQAEAGAWEAVRQRLLNQREAMQGKPSVELQRQLNHVEHLLEQLGKRAEREQAERRGREARRQEITNRLRELDRQLAEADEEVAKRERQLGILQKDGDARDRSKENVGFLDDKLRGARDRRKELERQRQRLRAERARLDETSRERGGGPPAEEDAPRVGPALDSSSADVARRKAAGLEPDAAARPDPDRTAREQAVDPRRRRVDASLARMRQAAEGAAADEVAFLREYYRSRPGQLSRDIDRLAAQKSSRSRFAEQDRNYVQRKRSQIVADQQSLAEMRSRLDRLQQRRPRSSDPTLGVNPHVEQIESLERQIRSESARIQRGLALVRRVEQRVQGTEAEVEAFERQILRLGSWRS